MQEGTFVACTVVQQEPLSLVADVFQVLRNSWGPLMGDEGLLVQEGEPAPALLRPRPLSMPGFISINGVQDAGLVYTAKCFTQS